MSTSHALPRDYAVSTSSQSQLVMAIPEPAEYGDVPPPDSEPAVIGENEARRILRHIDWRLMPLLFVTYMFNFMDKVILSSAAVFGLREDNVGHLYTTRCHSTNM